MCNINACEYLYNKNYLKSKWYDMRETIRRMKFIRVTENLHIKIFCLFYQFLFPFLFLKFNESSDFIGLFEFP